MPPVFLAETLSPAIDNTSTHLVDRWVGRPRSVPFERRQGPKSRRGAPGDHLRRLELQAVNEP
jgi:hypothetical protein